MEDKGDASMAVPAMVGFCGVGIGAMGFGAGYGMRSYRSSIAYKELVEKFPEVPTAEAEAFAKHGATRAFMGGTLLAGLMGVGAIAVARANGITSAAQLGDEIKKWLPSRQGLADNLEPTLEPLRRTITEHIQPVRDAASSRFKGSELGRRASERAQGSVKHKKLEPWEKELVSTLEGTAKKA